MVNIGSICTCKYSFYEGYELQKMESNHNYMYVLRRLGPIDLFCRIFQSIKER